MSYEEEKQDRMIEQLEAEIERLRGDNAGLSKAVIDVQEERDLAQAEFRAYHKAWEEGAARIQELEDALVEERARLYSLENTGTQLSQAGDQFQKRCRRSARNQLQAEGKIGPDAKPRSWKITDEREEALHVIEFADIPKYTAVLRAMLEEVEG